MPLSLSRPLNPSTHRRWGVHSPSDTDSNAAPRGLGEGTSSLRPELCRTVKKTYWVRQTPGLTGTPRGHRLQFRLLSISLADGKAVLVLQLF